MRIVVYGGRDWLMQIISHDALDAIDAKYHIHTVIQGGATGADAHGESWAHRNDVPCLECAAAWSKLDAPGALIRRGRNGKLYNARAGFDRNQRMLDEFEPEMALELPGGNGTADMRKRVIAAGVRRIVVHPYTFDSHRMPDEKENLAASEEDNQASTEAQESIRW